MSEFDEDTGYLVIKPGDRVLVEYDEPWLNDEFGGLGIVISVVNPWSARLDRGDGVARLHPRWLLRKPDP